MVRRLILAVVLFAVGFAPLAFAPTALAAISQMTSGQADCRCVNHQAEDEATLDCLPAANCMSQCFGTMASVVPPADGVRVSYAMEVPPPPRHDGRASTANYPPIRPPIL